MRAVVGPVVLVAWTAVAAAAGGPPLPELDARALLVESAGGEGDERGPEVRVDLQVRNAGGGKLRGCIGPSWGWSFPDSDDLGARTGTLVRTAPREMPFVLAADETFRWSERLAYTGPKAWIEAVRFEVDLLPGDCGGEPVVRLKSDPVMLRKPSEPRER